MPSRADVATLFAQLDDYERPHHVIEARLVALGAKAVPFLTRQLSDPRTGWNAAHLLGRIGRPAALPAVPALITAMTTAKTEPGRAWPARALAQLGQLDALEPLIRSRRGADHLSLAEGLKAGRPASYPLLERACDEAPAGFRRCLERTLAPGSAAFDVRRDALDQLLATAGSAHAVLRRDAMANLPNGRRADAARVAPVLVRALGDSDADVRRLAALGLMWLGRTAAKSALGPLRALKRDRVKKVRTTAALVLNRLGG